MGVGLTENILILNKSSQNFIMCTNRRVGNEKGDSRRLFIVILCAIDIFNFLRRKQIGVGAASM